MRYPIDFPAAWARGAVLVAALAAPVAAAPTTQGQSDQSASRAARIAEAPSNSGPGGAKVGEQQTPASESTPGRTFRDCEDCPEMVVVPAGKFMMGSADGDKDELPVHEVVIAKPFAVGKFEVTADEYAACVAADACRDPSLVYNRGARGRRPANDMAWFDAQNYVGWLSKKTGKSYRLLTEAEWEYAARAGTTTKYAFGDTITHDQANFSYGKPNEGGTKVVGSYPPNAWGLYDMHGNVWEWVEDCYEVDYEKAPADGSAYVYGGCPTRVMRGGSWDYVADEIRSSTRYAVKPLQRMFDEGGFRVARSLE
jgi:formylglycine-generating enzyme required for sulfatase activity